MLTVFTETEILLHWHTKAASNLADKAKHGYAFSIIAKGKLSQNIQDAIWHISDSGKFLKEVQDAAFCLLGNQHIALVKLQCTGMSLVIKCSDVRGGHKNLCRDCKRPSESTFPIR